MPKWPHAFARIVEIVGDDAARAICRAFGGRECYIAAFPRQGVGLAKVIGIDAAEKLAKEFGSHKISPPTMKITLKERILAENGTLTEIAARLGTSRSYVCQVKRGRAGGGYWTEKCSANREQEREA